MTQNKTINEQIEDEEYLDEKFPKGKSKLRGEAMVLLALARRRGKQEAQKMFLEEIDKLQSDTYYSCNCGNYDEGCINCFRIKLKSKIGGENDD